MPAQCWGSRGNSAVDWWARPPSTTSAVTPHLHASFPELQRGIPGPHPPSCLKPLDLLLVASLHAESEVLCGPCCCPSGPSSCGPHASRPVCPELPRASSSPSPAAPKPLELSKRLWGLEPRLTTGVWSQEEGSLKLRGKSRHSISSQPSFGVVSDRSAWNSL